MWKRWEDGERMGSLRGQKLGNHRQDGLQMEEEKTREQRWIERNAIQKVERSQVMKAVVMKLRWR